MIPSVAHTTGRLFTIQRMPIHVCSIRSKTRRPLKVTGNLSGSSQQWLRRQIKDPYAKSAIEMGYRARSAFKLLEIDEKFRFLSPGMSVIDVGAAPGSWTQVLIEKVNSKGSIPREAIGQVIAVDIGLMEDLNGAHILDQADITAESTRDRLITILGNEKVNAVVSDMAPNATGNKALDHERISNLLFTLWELSKTDLLKNYGVFLCKILAGSNVQRLMQELKPHFESVKQVKPPSSRDDSAELYILAQRFKKS